MRRAAAAGATTGRVCAEAPKSAGSRGMTMKAYQARIRFFNDVAPNPPPFRRFDLDPGIYDSESDEDLENAASGIAYYSWCEDGCEPDIVEIQRSDGVVKSYVIEDSGEGGDEPCFEANEMPDECPSAAARERGEGFLCGDCREEE